MNNSDKIRRARQSGLFDKESLDSYSKKLEKRLDEKIAKKEMEIQDRICGLKLERELIRSSLNGLLPNR